ncbi:MAG: type II toxin-antitoxin system RelE/ParE family toxin [Methylococcales bacterium]|jgi:toxin ParE1/3/4|nr:type II toxin-antitoxin system RelE/ParE family toxin [Methylococcales bacterium]MBT7410504.1 type II toxin-antitoxin system RelE/ParE family toxin [Methylococcales bacterium]
MKVFALTRKAKQDLRKIAIFTEKRWGRDQRYLYIKQFDDGFHLLSETPSIGKKCDYIKPGYRKFPQGSHIIYYREDTKSKVIVIRILHKNMDAESKFSDT